MSRDLIGATLWARQTLESDVFFWKPDKWFKIWFFIVNRVNHVDTKQFKRGEAYIDYAEISLKTKSTYGEVQSFMRWAKNCKMLSTQKSTRGNIIKVNKYNTFQSLETYKNPSIKQPVVQAQSKHNPSTIHAIVEECNNDKNVKNDITLSKDRDEINQLFKIFYESINPAINYGNKASRNAAQWLITQYGLEKALSTTTYACSIHGKDYAPVITTPYQLKEKLSALKGYYEREKNKQSNQQNRVIDLTNI